MLQPRDHLDLAQKALNADRVCKRCVEHLHRDLPSVLQVLGDEHCRHATGRDALTDAIPIADRGKRGPRIVGGRASVVVTNPTGSVGHVRTRVFGRRPSCERREDFYAIAPSATLTLAANLGRSTGFFSKSRMIKRSSRFGTPARYVAMDGGSLERCPVAIS